jgi:hypothetical protein
VGNNPGIFFIEEREDENPERSCQNLSFVVGAVKAAAANPND